MAKAKNIQPNLKTLIYSIEDRPYKIKEFLNYLEVDGYVMKGRNSSNEMVEAIKTIHNNGNYLSPNLAQALKTSPAREIDDYDIHLIKALANGGD